MFNLDPEDLLEIVFRTAVVYVFLLLILRLGGKSELGQMRFFDLVVVLIIANAVQNAMVGSDTSLTGGLVAATVLILIDRGLDRTALRSKRLGSLLAGTPTLLVNDGQVIEAHMRREGVGDDDLLTALREHGFTSPNDVQTAVLEVDGTISVVGRDAPVRRSRRRVRGRKPAE